MINYKTKLVPITRVKTRPKEDIGLGPITVASVNMGVAPKCFTRA